MDPWETQALVQYFLQKLLSQNYSKRSITKKMWNMAEYLI